MVYPNIWQYCCARYAILGMGLEFDLVISAKGYESVTFNGLSTLDDCVNLGDIALKKA